MRLVKKFNVVRFSLAALVSLLALAAFTPLAHAGGGDGFIVTLAGVPHDKRGEWLGTARGNRLEPREIMVDPLTGEILVIAGRGIGRLSPNGRDLELIAGSGLWLVVQGDAVEVGNLEAGNPIGGLIRASHLVVHPVTGDRYFIHDHRQIFKITADGSQLVHVAGTGVRNYTPGFTHGPAKEANLHPIELVFHPATHELYFTNAGSRILKLSARGDRVELVAGTGNQEFDGLGGAMTTNINPESLVFHPNAHKLFFISSKRILRLSGNEGEVKLVAGSGEVDLDDNDDEVPTTEEYANFDSNINPAKLAFQPITHKLFFRERSGTIRKQSSRTGELKTILGSMIRTDETGRTMAFDSTGQLYFTLGSKILRTTADGRTVEQLSGNRSDVTGDGPAAKVSLGFISGLVVHPGSGSLLFIHAGVLIDYDNRDLSIRAFVQPDDFAKTTLRRLMESGHAALAQIEAGGDEVENRHRLAAAISDLRLLAAPPVNLLQAVNQAASRWNKVENAATHEWEKTIDLGTNSWNPRAGQFKESFPDLTRAIVARIERDPGQIFRSIRALTCAKILEAEEAKVSAQLIKRGEEEGNHSEEELFKSRYTKFTATYDKHIAEGRPGQANRLKQALIHSFEYRPEKAKSWTKDFLHARVLEEVLARRNLRHFRGFYYKYGALKSRLELPREFKFGAFGVGRVDDSPAQIWQEMRDLDRELDSLALATKRGAQSLANSQPTNRVATMKTLIIGLERDFIRDRRPDWREAETGDVTKAMGEAIVRFVRAVRSRESLDAAQAVAKNYAACLRSTQELPDNSPAAARALEKLVVIAQDLSEQLKREPIGAESPRTEPAPAAGKAAVEKKRERDEAAEAKPEADSGEDKRVKAEPAVAAQQPEYPDQVPANDNNANGKRERDDYEAKPEAEPTEAKCGRADQ